MLKTINLNLKKILLLFALVFLSTVSNVKAQALACNTPIGFPLNGQVTINGLTVNTSSTGYVRLVDTRANGVCGSSVVMPIGSLQIGYLGEFTYTMTFSKPVNNIVVAMGGGGQINLNVTESFTFTTNNGQTPTLYSGPGQNCGATISGNNLTLNAINNPDTGGGGLFRISTPQSFTTLTIKGPGGYGGSTLAICEGSLVPAGPDITSVSTNKTSCLSNTTPVRLQVVSPNASQYQWYDNGTTNSNSGGTAYS